MSSAHFSVSLQFSMVPVWSDTETANSYCVFILCCEVELPVCGFRDAAHSEFEHVSLRRATLWLHITLKQERNKTVRKLNIKASSLRATSEKLKIILCYILCQTFFIRKKLRKRFAPTCNKSAGN